MNHNPSTVRFENAFYSNVQRSVRTHPARVRLCPVCCTWQSDGELGDDGINNSTDTLNTVPAVTVVHLFWIYLLFPESVTWRVGTGQCWSLLKEPCVILSLSLYLSLRISFRGFCLCSSALQSPDRVSWAWQSVNISEISSDQAVQRLRFELGCCTVL